VSPIAAVVGRLVRLRASALGHGPRWTKGVQRRVRVRSVEDTGP